MITIICVLNGQLEILTVRAFIVTESKAPTREGLIKITFLSTVLSWPPQVYTVFSLRTSASFRSAAHNKKIKIIADLL